MIVGSCARLDWIGKRGEPGRLYELWPGAMGQDAWTNQRVAHLEGTREVHALALVRTTHLTEGILHPPDLPQMREKPSETPDQERAAAPSPTQGKPPVWVSRYILGNWDESGPNKQSF